MKSGEFVLIDKIRSRFSVPDGVLGIGDDCAVIPQDGSKETLVTTDMLIEGVHFLMEDISPFDLGWKSAAVNISDIAAMGGKPVGSFLSFALPSRVDDDWALEFIDGYKDLSDKYDCPLLGGDSCASIGPVCINVGVLGECRKGAAKKRDAARVGDLICVSGPLGDSAAGLKLILENPGAARTGLESYLVQRHYRPLPKVQEGLVLAATDGVHSMMDISDGVGSDLRHILKTSGVGAEVDVNLIPLSEELKSICAEKGWDPLECALNGGEDYELLFTVKPDAVSAISNALEQTGSQLFIIGSVIPLSSVPSGQNDDSIIWKGSDKEFKGFTHY